MVQDEATSSASAVRTAAARRRRRGSGAHGGNRLAATVRAIFPKKSPPSLIKSPRAVLFSYLTATMSRQAEKAAAVAARGAPRGACGRHGCGPSSGGRRARPRPCISAPSRSLWGSGSLPTAAQAMLARGAAAEISPPPPRPPQRCSPTTPPLLALVRAPCLYGASGTSNFSFRQRLGLIEMASQSTTLR